MYSFLFRKNMVNLVLLWVNHIKELHKNNVISKQEVILFLNVSDSQLLNSKRL